VGESELSVTYDELLLEVAAFLGYSATAALWSTEQSEEVARYVQTGLRRFYYPPAAEGVESGYQWSFMKPVTTIATVADDVAQDLPSGLARVVGGFFYDENQHMSSIVQVSEIRYQAEVSRTESTGQPRLARVRHKPQSGLIGQRLEVAWWPIPDAAYTLTYQYEAYSGKLNEDNPYPLGGMRHAELVTESCLAIAEQRANDERGLHTGEFERQLRAAIEQDRRLGAKTYGHMGADHHGHPVPRHGDTGGTYSITYKGSEV
jgi:hypothetical protein